MKKNDQLIELINSMTKSEKRYFRIHAEHNTLKGENNLIKLFDIISKNKIEKIDTLIAKERFSNNIRATKHILYNLILKSLKNFNQDKNTKTKIRGMLDELDILFEKKLFSQYEHALDKTIKHIKKYDETEYELILAAYKYRLDKKNKSLIDYDGIEHQKKITDHIIKKILSKYELMYLHQMTSFIDIKYRFASVKEIKEKFSLISNNPYIRNHKIGSSFFTDILYYEIFTMYYILLKDPALLEILPKYRQIFKDKAGLTESNHNAYLNMFHSCAYGYTVINELTKAEKILQELFEKLSKASDEQKMIHLVSYYNQYLHLCFIKGDYTKGVSICNEVIDYTQKYKNELNSYSRTALLYNTALTYFLAQDYDTAIICLTTILNEIHLSSNEQIKGLAYILYLVTHYELGNDIIITPVAQRAKRFLKNRNRFQEFEELFIKYIPRISESMNKEKRKKLFNQLKKELLEKSELVSSYKEIIYWIDSKIENITFAEMLKRNLK